MNNGDSRRVRYVPTTKQMFGKALQIRGAVATKRPMPLRYASQESTTMVTGNHVLPVSLDFGVPALVLVHSE